MCEHLVIQDKLGTPSATKCKVHANRTAGMEITMHAADGSFSFVAECMMQYPRTKDAVPPDCSYVWIGEIEKKPEWSASYRLTE